MSNVTLDADKAGWMHDLRSLIERRVGLRVADHQREQLARIVAEACGRFGYADPPELLRALSTAPDDAPVVEHLIANVTIGESHFFRDRAQMAFLEQEFLPDLIARRESSSRTLRIWSAAASEGQELYSVAIMLDELIDRPDDWNLHLLGTDLNVEALRRATEGVYSNWSLRGLSNIRRLHYFDSTGKHDTRQVKAWMRTRARFVYQNLAADTFPSMLNDLHAMDLVLCRNVFIYFDAVRVREILQRIVATLAPGGVLLLGASDLVNPQIPGLDIEMRPGMCFYRKPLQHASPQTPMPKRPNKPAAPGWLGAARHAAGLSSGSRPVAKASRPAVADRHADFLATLQEQVAAQRWQEIAEFAERETDRFATSSEASLAVARALGNLGQQDAALRWCERALPLAATDPDAHFLHALLLQEASRVEEALKAFRRAIFLQPDFVLAHYQYALLQLGAGRREGGLRSLYNVRNLLAAAPADRALQGAEHMSCGRLAQIIDNELSLHHESRPG